LLLEAELLQRPESSRGDEVRVYGGGGDRDWAWVLMANEPYLDLDTPPPWWRLGFDSKALLEAVVGSVVGLIALFLSDDHVFLPHRRLPLQQQLAASGSSLSRFRSLLRMLY
jgi:hypothetical protein